MIHDQKPFTAAAKPGGAPRRSAAASAYASANGDHVADRVRRFTPMVRRLAWHLHGSGRDGIEVEDLMQAGMVALTECAQRHTGPSEDGFAAYVKMRVRGAMVDLIRRQVPLSRGASERRRQLRDKEGALRLQLGREPLAQELATAMGIGESELEAMRAAGEAVRFEPIDEAYADDNVAFADTGPDSFTMLADEEAREKVVAAIAALPERLQLVIQLYFVEELNLAEIAQVLEVSIPRVHQLKAQALERLRTALEGVVDIL